MNAPTRARACRDLNDRNGVLVGAQIKRVEGTAGRASPAPSAAPRAYGPRRAANPYAAPARCFRPKPDLLSAGSMELALHDALSPARLFFPLD